MDPEPSPRTPRHKSDIDAVDTIVSADWETLDPLAPAILEWMQDLNWPVARALQPYLAGIGTPLAPYVRAVLCSDDDIWKHSLLVGIVSQSPALACALQTDLERLANNPTLGERKEYVDEEARDILAALAAPEFKPNCTPS